jgi:hypothetical protein
MPFSPTAKGADPPMNRDQILEKESAMNLDDY